MGEVPTQKPENNLVWAILSTVLCCLPLGIVAIIKANSVDTLWASGDYEGAAKAAQDARKWSIIGAITGFVVGMIYLISIVVFTILSESNF